jgi:hypothetical protein
MDKRGGKRGRAQGWDNFAQTKKGTSMNSIAVFGMLALIVIVAVCLVLAIRKDNPQKWM